MGFYEEQKNAFNGIEQTLKKHKKIDSDALISQMLLAYAVSERALRRFIIMLERAGTVSVKDNTIRWNG